MIFNCLILPIRLFNIPALSFVLYMMTIELALRGIPGDSSQGCKDLDRIIAICQEDESSELMETDMFAVLKSKEDYASFLLLCAFYSIC